MNSSAADTGQRAAAAPTTQQRFTPVAAVRCLLGFACSHLAAPYFAARTMIRYSLEGSFEPVYLLATVVILLLGAVCTFGQLKAQPSERRRLYASTGVVLWIAVAGLQLVIAVDTEMSQWLLTVLWAVGSAWVPWAVWAFAFYGWRGTLMGSVTVVLSSIAFWQLVDVTGLTGDARVEFAWRHQEKPSAPLQLPVQNAAAPASPIRWPGYLGGQRNAIVSDARIVGDWSAQPPEEQWRVSCGAGWSSLAATQTTLFTQEQINGEDCVTARRLSDGKLIWTNSEQRPGFQSGLGGNGPRATPTLHSVMDAEGRPQPVLLTVGPTGLLQSLNATDGSEVWSVDLAEAYAGENLTHGVCASPLVYDSFVIVCPAAPDGPCLAAFDLRTGQPAWTSDAGWRSSYCSPQLSQLAGRDQMVVHAGPGVLAVDPRDGRSLWQFEWTNEWDNNATQPLPLPEHSDQLVIATGYRGGAVRLKLQPTDDGGFVAEEQWQTSRTLRTKFCNMTFMSNLIIGLDNGILCAVDPNDGSVVWKKGRYGHGQLLQVGSQLVVISERGDVCLLQPDASGPHETGRFTALDRKTWNHPVLIDDLLVVRNDQQIACYQLQLQP